MEEMQYQEMTLEDIFRALKKRWLLIVSVTLMCLIGGSIFVLFFGPEPVYQASTTVLVNYRAEETNKLTQSDLTTSQKLVATYTEIIKSATILEPVIKALDLDMTADELLKNIGVAKV
ncbi:chain-length determining protein, partial [Turicibacter sanguinis]|nr:chain-length determining protein [Turicibacter sanguinis]